MKRITRLLVELVTVMLLVINAVSGLSLRDSVLNAEDATSTVTYNNKTYITMTGSDMAYRKDATAFDFIGKYNGVWKRVSYSTNGFGTILTTGGTQNSDININNGAEYNNIKVDTNFIFAKDGSLQVAYSVTNTAGSSRTFSLGSHADIQIGESDSAPITPFTQRTADSKVKGFMMNELTSGAQFNFYARGYSGVTTVDSVWYGKYSDRKANIYNDVGYGSNLTDTDSGMAFSWINRTIPANSTQTYNVKFIIAEKGSENNVASSGTISLIHIGAIQHSFAVYQLMDGSVDSNNTYASIMNWGTGISDYEKLDGTHISTTAGSVVPLNVMTEFVESDENSEKTALIERITVGTPIRTGTSVNGSIAFPNLPCGYYLIRDTTVLSEDSGDIVSRDILVYLDDEGRAIELKRVKPSFDKTVATDAMAGKEWAEAADYAFGQNFNFRLTASIPANEDFGGYSTYQLVFHDTYSSGIDFVGIHSVTYTVGTGEPQTIGSESYNLTTVTNGFTLSIGNFAAVAGDAWGSADNDIHVDVIYTAKLNKTAPTINESAQDASYTAPNSKVSSNGAYLQYSNNPTNHDSLGLTAEDYVGVFSYKLINTKYANFATDGYQLDGAVFRLYYNSVSDDNEIFMIYDDQLHAYRPVQGSEESAAMISGYGLNDPQYKGKLDMTGIDAGTYVLVETQAPAGYTPIDNLTFTINAVPEENPAGTGAIDTLTIYSGANKPDEDEKGGVSGAATSLNNQIINVLSSNKTLPQTGGIGTKIFYVVGISMVVGAVIVLIVKKRIKDNDK